MDLKELLRQQWDRIGAWVAIAIGGLCLLLGWLGVSDTVFPSEQLPYIVSGGLVGACLVGIGATLWLSADLRDEWTELHHIARQLEERGSSTSDDAGPAVEDAGPPEGSAPSPPRSTNGRSPRVAAGRK